MEKNPSKLQLEACVRETEKIASLINRQSPRIASELSLSSLTAATPVHSYPTADAFLGGKYFNSAGTKYILERFRFAFILYLVVLYL